MSSTKQTLPAAAPHVVPVNPCQSCSVRDASVCGVLDPPELQRLSAITRQIHADPQRIIFFEGDEADYLFNVTAGAVRVYKLLIDGRRQITGFMFPGDFLGLALHNRYTYSAEAVRHAQLCRFPRRAFEALLEEYPRLERRLLQSASNELAAAQDQMLLLGRKTAQERIATMLLSLLERARRRGAVSNIVPLPMSRGDIGDYLGLTIETVSRTLGRLKKRAVIALPRPHDVDILDLKALQDIAGIETLDEPLAASALAASG